MQEQYPFEDVGSGGGNAETSVNGDLALWQGVTLSFKI